MQLSRQQRALLTRYRRLREDPPTIMKLIASSVIAIAAPSMVIAAGIAALAAFEVLSVPLTLFFVGMAVGAFSRDLGGFRRLCHAWPVPEKVMDWNQINAILSTDQLISQKP